MEREWHTSPELQCISVMTWVPEDHENFTRPSTCAATCMGDHWYLNRVKVHNSDKGQGIGKELVAHLQKALSERWALEQDHPESHRLIVTPGGYGSNPADLEKFYAACGFKTKTPVPELLMEWKP